MHHLRNAWNAWKSGWVQLTATQQMIAVFLLFAYVAMIGLVILTAPYNGGSLQNDWMLPGLG